MRWINKRNKGIRKNVRQAVDNEEIRQDIVASMNLTFHEQMKLQNKLYWQIFSEYDWFEGYYRGDVNNRDDR